MRRPVFFLFGFFTVALAACGGSIVQPQSPIAPLPSSGPIAAYRSTAFFAVVPRAAHRRRHAIRLGRMHFFVPRRQPRERRGLHSRAVQNMTYHGGPVQTSPELYVIFWGFSNPPTSDTTDDPDGMASYLLSFLRDVDCSSWLDTVEQYDGPPGAYVAIPCTHLLAGVYTDPSPPPSTQYTQQQVAQEVQTVAAFYNVGGFDANFIVVTPTGYAQPGFGTTFCAYHSWYTGGAAVQPYTLLPYVPDKYCGSGFVNTPGTLDGVTINAGHEIAETMTDPELTAWYDSSETAPYCSANATCEIGDKCAWTELQDTPLNGGAFPTQPLWSDAASACVQTSTLPPPTPSGSPTPSPTASPTASPSPVPTASPSPKPTAVPTATPTPPPTPTPAPTYGPIALRPAALQFERVGRAHRKRVHVAQAYYAGTFSKASTCKGIATIERIADGGGRALYEVVPRSHGRCVATFFGGAPQSATLTIDVRR